MTTRLFSSLPAKTFSAPSVTCRVALALVVGALGLLASSTDGRADTVVYANVQGIQNFQSNGGATVGTPHTALLGDDIGFIAGAAGQTVDLVAFTISNNNGLAVTATPTVEFFAVNTSTGAPSTLLYSQTLASMNIPSAGLASVPFVPVGFTIPTSDTIWATVYYSSATATVTQLNNLGQSTEGIPTVGTSNASTIFVGNGPAGSTSNPSGTVTAASASGAISNFGWAFSIPEPSSVAFLAIGGAGLVGLLLRQRRASKT